MEYYGKPLGMTLKDGPRTISATATEYIFTNFRNSYDEEVYTYQ
jgi:hypothetical protein